MISDIQFKCITISIWNSFGPQKTIPGAGQHWRIAEFQLLAAIRFHTIVPKRDYPSGVGVYDPYNPLRT